MYGNARVYGGAKVGEDTCVYGNAIIGQNAEVSGGKWKVAPLQIIGSRDLLQIIKPKVIKISCGEYSINWWLKNYKQIGLENDYSKKEIEEYGSYIKFISKNRNRPNIAGEKII